MKWDYHIYSYRQPSGVLFRGAGDTPEEVDRDIKKLGKEGWELSAAYPVAMAQGATNSIVIIFKRPIAE
jgi:Domain of unknown function (DUF4177)